MNKDGGFGLFGFLCFVALVAVIFGVNMHEAFWGIMGVGALLLVIGLICYWIISYADKPPTQPQITEAQIVQPKPTVQPKLKTAKTNGSFIFWVIMAPIYYIVSGLIAGWLCNLILKIVPNYINSNDVTILMGVLWIGLGIIAVLITEIIREKRRDKKAHQL